mmetsp:Transcript_76611/g.135288  ORF Transcript_76611/g.135288 Transcript_76611/m.135288 type:complete len:325 (+) Transcript_76611:2596-3570(+)
MVRGMLTVTLRGTDSVGPVTLRVRVPVGENVVVGTLVRVSVSLCVAEGKFEMLIEALALRLQVRVQLGVEVGLAVTVRVSECEEDGDRLALLVALADIVLLRLVDAEGELVRLTLLVPVVLGLGLPSDAVGDALGLCEALSVLVIRKLLVEVRLWVRDAIDREEVTLPEEEAVALREVDRVLLGLGDTVWLVEGVGVQLPEADLTEFDPDTEAVVEHVGVVDSVRLGEAVVLPLHVLLAEEDEVAESEGEDEGDGDGLTLQLRDVDSVTEEEPEKLKLLLVLYEALGLGLTELLGLDDWLDDAELLADPLPLPEAEKLQDRVKE